MRICALLVGHRWVVSAKNLATAPAAVFVAIRGQVYNDLIMTVCIVRDC
jgi:hypothetical protein